MPWVREVLPAPRPPVSTTRSPARSRAPSLAPHAWVSSIVGSSTRRDASPSGGTAATSLKCLDPSDLGEVSDRAANPWLVARVEVDHGGTLGPREERYKLLADHIAMLQHDEVTGIVDQDVLGARDQPDDLLAVLRRREHVLNPVDHHGLHADEGLKGLTLVMLVERLDEGRDDLHAGLEDHVGCQPHHAERHR